ETFMMWNLKKFIVLLLFANLCHSDETCDIASVHVTNEDGSQHTFSMKQLTNPEKHCTTCGTQISTDPFSVGLMPSIAADMGMPNIPCEKDGDDLCKLCQGDQENNPECEANEDLLKAAAQSLIDKGHIVIASGDEEVDDKIAYGMVLLLSGLVDASIDQLTSVIQNGKDFNISVAHRGRGMAYTKKAKENVSFLGKALADYTKAIELNNSDPDNYERRAEVLLAAGRYTQASEDIQKALKIKRSVKLQFLLGIVKLGTWDFVGAKKELRGVLDVEEKNYQALYYLGLALYNMGEIRNAIEAYKEAIALKPDTPEVHTSLAHAYKELGNQKSARQSFNTSLTLDSNVAMTWQLRGAMYQNLGQPGHSIQDMQKCLELDQHNRVCEYIQGVAHMAQGQFFEAVKDHTRLIAYKPRPMLKLPPEMLKAHYLREYSRYLHAELDTSISDFNPDNQLDGEFRDHWAKLLPFIFEKYTEQPGIQPNIEDVSLPEFSEYESDVQGLICRAEKIGKLSQINADGYSVNKRLNLAIGLAAIHTAQSMEAIFRGGTSKHIKPDQRYHWRDLYNIAVPYRRLYDMENPVFWLDLMPEERQREGYNSDLNFIRGQTKNLRLRSYFNLVFSLIQTMIQRNQDNTAFSAKFKDQIRKAKTCEDILQISKDYNLNQEGYMVSIQVPCFPERIKEQKGDQAIEGIILTLTGEKSGNTQFSINIANTKERINSFHIELDYIFNRLQEEGRKAVSGKLNESDGIMNLILSLTYYFYNLSPLSRGTSAVAYSVLLGLTMAVGREITGKLPQGKLLDLEAMLSSSPNTFITVVKQWFNIKRLNSPVSTLPKVADSFPTVRSVIEVLNLSHSLSC
ncbi:unnamed protein product, partial [Owenia fusiformis]